MGNPQELQDAFTEFDEQVRISDLCYSDYINLEEKAKSLSLYPPLPLLERKMVVAELTLSDIDSWNELAPAAGSPESIKLLEHLKTRYPTPDTWLSYLAYVEPNEQDLLRAFAQCRSNYKKGWLIFQKVVEYYTRIDPSPEKLRKVYEQMLSTPHEQLDQTYQDYSTLVSSYWNDTYLTIMKTASKLKSKSAESLSYYIVLERNITEEPLTTKHWTTYIESCAKHLQKNEPFAAIEEIFFRSVVETSMFSNEKWIPVWVSFLDIVKRFEPARFRHFVKLFIKSYPGTVDGYVEYSKQVDYDSVEFPFLRKELLRFVNSQDLANPSWKTVSNALLTIHFKQLTKMRDISVVLTLEDISSVASAAFAREGSVDILSLAITLSRRFSSGEDDFFDLFIDLTTATFDRWPNSAAVWVTCFQLLALYGPPKYGKRMLKLLPEDLEQLDDPMKAINCAIIHQAMHGQPEDIELLTTLQKKYADKVVTTYVTKDQKRTSPEEIDRVEPKKSKLQTENDVPGRSREMFRVKVENIPASASLQSVSDFFNGYCDPITINVHKSVQGNFALVELKSEEEVLKALVRDQKLIDGSTVSVKRIFGNTLWVTNYPPQWGPSELEGYLSSQDLPFINVRFPSQNDKREKRFCYIDFPDTATTQAAQSRLDKQVIEGLTLKADISNPSLKQKRGGPDITHQVYVRNINFETTNEETLRQFFSEVGKVEDVKVPLNQENRLKGLKNNGYAFVTFADAKAVKKALDVSGNVLDGRNIEVLRGKSKQSMKLAAPQDFAKDKTISLFNVNSIATKAHLEEFLHTKVGPTTKVHVKPSKKAALVEFEKQADAGKASLILEGSLFEEEVLHLGTIEDYFKQDEEKRPRQKPTMAPPMLMRKKRR